MVHILDFPAGDVIRPDPGPLPELPDKIWERILGYATHVSGHNYLQMDADLYRRASWPPINVTRRNILVVCKRFYVGISLASSLALQTRKLTCSCTSAPRARLHVCGAALRGTER